MAASTDRPLPELAAAWAGETLGVDGAKPYVALGPAAARGPYIAVSLGVGENPAKRLPDPFEEELLRLLAERGLPLCIDKGRGRRRGRARRARCGTFRRASHFLGRIVRRFRRHHRRQPASMWVTIPPASTSPPPPESR